MKSEEGRMERQTLKNNKAAANSSFFILHSSLFFVPLHAQNDYIYN
jgi:hypothetical protein